MGGALNQFAVGRLLRIIGIGLHAIALLVVSYDSFDINFKLRYMTNYQPPKKCRLDIVVGMNYAVARINNGPGVRNFKCRICLPNSVYSFAHYFSLSLDDADTHYIFLEKIVSVGKTDKATLQIVYCVEDVLKICQGFFISHISSVLCG